MSNVMRIVYVLIAVLVIIWADLGAIDPVVADRLIIVIAALIIANGMGKIATVSTGTSDTGTVTIQEVE